MNNKKRVLHIIHSFNMGGAESWLIEILRYRKVKNISNFPLFDFVITSGEKSVLDDRAEELGAKLFYLKFNKREIYSFIKSFRSLLKSNNYLAIHNHQSYLSGWHFLFGTFLLPPVRITHTHNASYQVSEHYGVNVLRKFNIYFGNLLVLLFATKIVGTSKQVLRDYKYLTFPFSLRNPEPLYCSFELEKFNKVSLKENTNLLKSLDISTTDKIIIFIGRFDKSVKIDAKSNGKNSAFALHVFSQMKVKNCKMLFVGKNTRSKQKFIALAEKLNVENDIRILGIRNDVSDLLSISNLLLFPSRAEGLGMVVVEAQASGIKVLSSDSIPLESVVIDDLVTRVNLDKGVAYWADVASEILNESNDKYDSLKDKRFLDSPFNLSNSLERLIEIYSENQVHN